MIMLTYHTTYYAGTIYQCVQSHDIRECVFTADNTAFGSSIMWYRACQHIVNAATATAASSSFRFGITLPKGAIGRASVPVRKGQAVYFDRRKEGCGFESS